MYTHMRLSWLALDKEGKVAGMELGLDWILRYPYRKTHKRSNDNVDLHSKMIYHKERLRFKKNSHQTATSRYSPRTPYP